MAHVGSFFTVPPPVAARSEPETTVVWLAAEHDISPDGALCLTPALAIAPEPAAIVIDLSGVALISASTLKTIARARELVRQRSGSLPVRSPSFGQRIIDTCELTDLLGAEAGTWEESAQLLGGSAGDRAAREAARSVRAAARPRPRHA